MHAHNILLRYLLRNTLIPQYLKLQTVQTAGFIKIFQGAPIFKPIHIMAEYCHINQFFHLSNSAFPIFSKLKND